MAASNEYFALLDTLKLNTLSIDVLWEMFQSDYVAKENVTDTLELLAESALTIIARHKARLDTIAGGRGINWWFGFLIGEMEQLHRNKNAGYSGHNDDPWHNFRQCNVFGVSTEHGIIARMCDKHARYTNVSNDPKLELVGEKWYDTLQDLAAYALILVCILKEQKHES